MHYLILWAAPNLRTTIPITRLWRMIIICFMLFSSANAQSQSVLPRTASLDTTPLKIGDTIPEELWNLPMQVANHPEGKETITLDDYRDKKLIILDFWNTWCGSCLTSMRNMEPLVQKHAGNIVILPVTVQSRSDIEKFRLKNETVAKTSLTLVVDDQLLSVTFPHVFFPHAVFIKRGKVLHIGGAESTSERNLLSFLKNQPQDTLSVKNDFSYTFPLIEHTNDMVIGAIYYNALTGYRRDSSPTRGEVIDSVSGTKRIYFYNHALFDLIKEGLSLNSFPQNRIVFNDAIWNLKNFAYHKSAGNREAWLKSNSFCYEVNVPITISDSSIREMLMRDVEELLGLNVKIETKEIEVLEITGRKAPPEGKNDNRLISTSFLMDAYNRLPTSTPLIDTHDFASNTFFINVDYSKWDERKLLAAIEESGLDIRKTTSHQKVLYVERRKL